MLDRFQGCMLGALVGDCIGAEFEFIRGERLVPRQQVTAHLAAVKAGKRGEPERYTDDTAMARQIALRCADTYAMAPVASVVADLPPTAPPAMRRRRRRRR